MPWRASHGFAYQIEGVGLLRLPCFLSHNDAVHKNIKYAEDLWTRGYAHLLGAKALEREARREAIDAGAADVEKATFNGHYSASMHLLIGYAFELTLKTAYLLHGGSREELQRGIGHDLVLALDEAERLGFRSSVPNLRWIIENLREPHHRHQFRYGGPKSIKMPGLELSLPALDALAREIGETGSFWRVRGAAR